MPALRTLFDWLHSHGEFRDLLNRATLAKADIYFEESISICDEAVADNAQASRQRTRVLARQWACARLNPARYAERLAVGRAPELPREPTDLDLVDVTRRLAFMLAKTDRILQEQPALQLASESQGTTR